MSCGTYLQQFSILATHHTCIEFLHVRIIVRGHDDAAAAAADLEKQIEDLHRCFRIQIPGGFIGQDQFRIVQERPRDAHALLFAAGKFVRHLVTLVRKADLLKDLLHAIIHPLLLLPACGLEHEEQIIVHCAIAQQLEILEHDPDLAAQVRDL